MAGNTSPIFALSPNAVPARIAAANTARDGSGSLVTVLTAGANGTRIDWVKITSAQASAAASSSMVVGLFITDAAGANPRALIESLLTTLTPSTTVIGSTVVFDFMNGQTLNNATITYNGIFGGVILQSGQLLKARQSIFAGAQDQNDVTYKAGDL